MLCTVLSLSIYTYLIISRKDSRLCSVQYYHSLLMLCAILSLCLYILDHLQKGLPLVNKPRHLVECAAQGGGPPAQLPGQEGGGRRRGRRGR
jgi:hypothetical protein